MISLALLIGGHGSRMGGVDKASLVLPSGLTTSETLLATFRPLVGDAFAVGRADQRDHPLSRSMRIVADTRPEEGPLGGIATALAAARSPWVFIVACDLVGLIPDDLACLARERARARLAVGWLSPSGPEPLCALYHRALAGTADRLLAHEERRARSLLESAHLVPRPTMLVNLNTPGEAAKVTARPTRS